LETLPVHLYKDSFKDFLGLLNEHQIQYAIREQRANVPMAAASGIIELVQNPAMWGALATVIIAFTKTRRSRKVVITLKDKTVVHAEGLSQSELEKVLIHAKTLSAIETQADENTEA